uniref:Sulfotransferase domain-containing protein n=1 Tax=Alexandrium catenella TaxID=2925 RepID=A0A7S1L3H7_ALECA|mmetsp:Transcript_105657/g.281430  ORF Transcript_105657/g.281430 Transcript_105657/m.281430 type:complete len:373 (+) Transcript_105657:91-1209(+)
MPLPVPLLGVALCGALWTARAGSCAGREDSRDQCVRSSAPRLLQTSPLASGLAAWETLKVQDGPAALPPQRAPPPCDVSAATGACLPGFMVIGMQKSGTSSLFNILSTHPQVRPASKKELLFFNGNFERLRCSPPSTRPDDVEFLQYLGSFPQLHDSAVLTGEFSATYMHCWCCPSAMHRLMPGLRLVTQLRDPIERARSRWNEQHNWFKLTETHGSFEEYIDLELPKLQACLETADGKLEEEVHCADQSNVLGLSLYDSAIRLWLSQYEPRNFLVTYLEQLAVDPQSVVSAIQRHLGIDDRRYAPEVLSKKYNAEGAYGWKAASASLYVQSSTGLQMLYDFYRPHMQSLKTLADDGLISPLPRSWIARWKL